MNIFPLGAQADLFVLILFFSGTPKILKPERPIDTEVNLLQNPSCLYFLVVYNFPFNDLKIILVVNCSFQKSAATKVSSMFGGTRDKCVGCKATVYPTEKVKKGCPASN